MSFDADLEEIARMSREDPEGALDRLVATGGPSGLSASRAFRWHELKGRCLRFLLRLEEASAAFEEARRLATEDDDMANERLSILIDLALVYHSRGLYAQGQECLERFFESAAEGAPALRARAMGVYAGILLAVGHEKDALSMAEGGIDLLSGSGMGSIAEQRQMALLYGTSADCLIRLGHPNEALIRARLAKTFASKTGDNVSHMPIIAIEANALETLGRDPEARELYEYCMYLAEAHGIFKAHTEVAARYARFLSRTGAHDEALQVVDAALARPHTDEPASVP